MIRTVVLIAAVVASASSAHAYNWNSRASYKSEMQRQQARIVDGRRAGALNSTEHNVVRYRLSQIRAMRYNSVARRMLSRHSKTIAFHKTN